MSSSVKEFMGCSWEGEWPDRLRRSVRRTLRHAGVSRAEWIERGLDVHHVVAAGLEGAAPGRRVVARWSVGVHNVVNAAIIPRSFHQGQGLHRHSFLDVVNRRLSSADAFATGLLPRVGYGSARLIIVKTIQKIGEELVLRSGDVLALRLQAALQDRASVLVAPRVEVEPWPTCGLVAQKGAGGGQGSYGSAEGADLDDEAVFASRGSRLPLAPAC